MNFSEISGGEEEEKEGQKERRREGKGVSGGEGEGGMGGRENLEVVSSVMGVGNKER